jgi:nucleoside-diphosphate-sugar epimerase
MGSVGEALVRRDIEQVLSGAAAFSQLQGAHILLTGGTGFIGTWLLEALAYLNDHSSKACTVYIPTRNRQAFANRAPHLVRRSEFIILEGDICSFTYPDVPCNFIIHAAAPYITQADPLEVIETIVDGTRYVLELAKQKNVQRFLFISSGAVYGTQLPDCERIPENYTGIVKLNAPSSAYGEAKRLAEVLCAIYHQQFNVPVSTARLFTFVGPYQSLDAGFAVTDFIRDGLSGKTIKINSDGSTLRSYCYGADAAKWLLAILLNGPNNTAYNVGSDIPISIRQLAEKVVEHLAEIGIYATIDILHEPVANSPVNRYIPDTRLAKQQFGLTLSFDLDHALSHTVQWFADQLNKDAIT